MHLHTNIRTSSDLDAQLEGAPDVKRQALRLLSEVVPIGMWHYNQMPNMDGLPEDAMKVGAFVLDRLARFACVSVEFKNRVFHFLDELANQLAKRVDTPNASAKIDKLAVKWGVNADLRGYMKELLPLQTRHAFC